MKKAAILWALAVSSIAVSSACGELSNSSSSVIGCTLRGGGTTQYYKIENDKIYQQAPEGWRKINGAVVTITRVTWTTNIVGTQIWNIDRKSGIMENTNIDPYYQGFYSCTKFIENERKF